MPAPARQTQPETTPGVETLPASPASAPIALDGETPFALAAYSPALALQDQLHDRLLGDREPADYVRFPVPVRIALLAAGAAGSWALVYALARGALALVE